MIPLWKNLGFVIYITLYFYITKAYDTWPAQTLTSVAFKVLPIMHIMLIVISVSLEEKSKTPEAKRYIRHVLAGLFFSMLGDAALVYKEDYFLPGLVFFAITQALYVRAFRFQPLGSGPALATFVILGAFFYMYVSKGMGSEGTVVRIGTMVYAMLIFSMIWRAFVRATRLGTFASVMALIGATSFVASDFMLSLDKWGGAIENTPLWVMVTYYVAQVFIGLSACDGCPAEEETFRKSEAGVKSS